MKQKIVILGFSLLLVSRMVLCSDIQSQTQDSSLSQSLLKTFDPMQGSPQVDTRNSQLTMSVAPKTYTKLKLLLVSVGQQKQELKNILAIIKKDLEFSGQFVVDIEPCE